MLGGSLPRPAAAWTNLTATMLIDLDAELCTVLSPTTVQVNSPHHIPAALRAPFEAREKALILVDPLSKKTLPVTLRAWDETALLADIAYSPGLRRPGDRLLVIFPILPQQRYVIQTQVEEVYLDRLKLHYQDPRYDVRHTIPLLDPVMVDIVPKELSTAWEQRQVVLTRHCSLPPETWISMAQEGSVSDLFSDSTLATSTLPGSGDASATRLVCRLHDLSPGGVGLICDSVQQPTALQHRLLWAHIRLPMRFAAHTWYLTLVPCGVVRAVRRTPRGWMLHVRFLKRLPDAMSTVCEHLTQAGSAAPQGALL
jgi:hypothetical protein